MDKSIDDIVEERIREAMAAGAFDGLKGAGRPLRADPSEALAGDQWLGFKVLQNGGTLPAWLALAREIEVERGALKAIDARHAEWVALAAESGDWARHAPALRRLRNDYERKARELRARQDRYNLDAPSLALERPGVWVEYLVSRLDERLREAGAPDGVFEPPPAG